MKPPRRILVPVDFSPCSDEAVEFAADLAQQFGARLDLLHVWQPPEQLGAFIGLSTVQAPDGRTRTLAEFIMDGAHRELDGLLEQLEGRDLPHYHARLECGTPRAVILEVLEKGNFDLVVMGTHGRTGLAHLFTGSVAEWVVRHASVPVLTVRRPGSRSSMRPSPRDAAHA